MKKSVVFILILIATIQINAQNSWTFHPDLGVNFSLIDDGGISGITAKSGINVSINFVQQVEERWSLDYALSVNKRFATYSSSSTSDELTDLLNIGNLPIISDFDFTIYNDLQALTSYWTIDLPLTATYSFKSGLFLYGGGYINYLMSASHEETRTTHIPIFEVVDPEDLTFIDPALIPFIPENKVERESIDSKNDMNEFGYGVIGGMGYKTKSFILKANYQHGFSDLRTDEMKMGISSQRTIQLSVGYLINELFVTSKEKPKYDLDVIE